MPSMGVSKCLQNAWGRGVGPTLICQQGYAACGNGMPIASTARHSGVMVNWRRFGFLTDEEERL